MTVLDPTVAGPPAVRTGRGSFPGRYLLGRLGLFVLTLWAAVTVNFVLPRLMPARPPTRPSPSSPRTVP